MTEREAIVAWLRREADSHERLSLHPTLNHRDAVAHLNRADALVRAAHYVERGAHMQEQADD